MCNIVLLLFHDTCFETPGDSHEIAGGDDRKQYKADVAKSNAGDAILF